MINTDKYFSHNININWKNILYIIITNIITIIIIAITINLAIHFQYNYYISFFVFRSMLDGLLWKLIFRFSPLCREGKSPCFGLTLRELPFELSWFQY